MSTGPQSGSVAKALASAIGDCDWDCGYPLLRPALWDLAASRPHKATLYLVEPTVDAFLPCPGGIVDSFELPHCRLVQHGQTPRVIDAGAQVLKAFLDAVETPVVVLQLVVDPLQLCVHLAQMGNDEQLSFILHLRTSEGALKPVWAARTWAG